jgi:hypothetical protein
MSGRKTIKEFYDWIYHDKGLYFKRKFEAFLDQNLDTGYRNIAKCEIKDKTCCCRKKKAFIDEYEMSFIQQNLLLKGYQHYRLTEPNNKNFIIKDHKNKRP